MELKKTKIRRCNSWRTVSGGLKLCALAVVLSGCSVERDGGGEGQVPIVLTTSVAGSPVASTRAGQDIQTSQFDADQTFSAYFEGGATSVVNITYTTNGSGGTTPSEQPYFTLSGTTATVHAYYPSTVTNSVTSFSVQTDQRESSGYKASDLMYATRTLTKSGAMVTGVLSFRHLMSKILVDVTASTGISAVRSVRIVGGSKTVALTQPGCTLGSVSDGLSSSSFITLHSGGTTTTASCAGLIPPQSVTGNFLEVETDAGTAVYSLTGTRLESGKTYRVRLTVNATAIRVSATAITDWEEVSDVTLYNNGTNNTVSSTMAAVDLGIRYNGMPVLFANMNLGATDESDDGLFFAWADVNGYTATEGHVFSNAVYTQSGAYTAGHYGKYDVNSTDFNPMELLDDAARYWGENLRLPTYQEANALVNTKEAGTCTWTVEENYNNTGRTVVKVVSNISGYQGNTLIIPLTGAFNKGTAIRGDENVNTWLWTNTWKPYPATPRNLLMGCPIRIVTSGSAISKLGVPRENCYWGCPIRPVYELTAVDLGLPSGTKWATMNIGASSETDPGEFFSWGSIEAWQKDVSTDKMMKNYSTYKWADGSHSTADNILTKYVTNASKGKDGFTDGKTMLDPEDDAAHVYWGYNWTMPTNADYTELDNNCNFVSQTNYKGSGMDGWLLTSKINGKSIFLPASGYIEEDSYKTDHTWYWSKTLGGSSHTGVTYHVKSAGTLIHTPNVSGKRCYGMPIRPVWKD